MRIILLSGIIILAMAFTTYKTAIPVSSNYRWVKLTDHAAFSKSYNFQLLSHHDTLWAFHPQGNYFSLDGKQWIKSPLTNIIHNLAFLDYVYFNQSVYGLGHFVGNIEKFALTTPVHRSTNFKSWKLLAKESNLPKRFFYHPVVFKNKIWLYGGSDTQQKYGDVWSSTDGVQWKKEANSTSFGKRDGQQFVVFKNKLYMLEKDVWSSEDGLNWTKVTDKIVNEDIFGYAAIVYDNKIWLMGCSRNGKFGSEVLVSTDGKTWESQRAPWSPRGGVALCLHKGKVYLTGGKYGGQDINHPQFEYSNDVWTLEKI